MCDAFSERVSLHRPRNAAAFTTTLQIDHNHHAGSRGSADHRELAAKSLFCAQADLSSSWFWLLSACVRGVQGLERKGRAKQPQKYNMHESIQPEVVGQHACEAVTECLGLPYEAHKANLQWLKSRTLAALRDANIAFDIGAWQSASFVARIAFSPRTPDSSGFSASQQAAEWRDRRVQELETSVANAFRALADCVDVAAFDNNVRVWGMLSWIYAQRGIRDINLTSANRWKIPAECNEQCDPALPLHKFLKLCSAIYKHSQAGNCSNSAYSTHAADVNLWHLAGRNEVQDLI